MHNTSNNKYKVILQSITISNESDRFKLFEFKAYDWLRMHQSVQFSTRAQNGTKFVWMNRSAYVHRMAIQEGMVRPQALQEFANKLQTLHKDQISTFGEKVLVSAEEFLISMEETV